MELAPLIAEPQRAEGGETADADDEPDSRTIHVESTAALHPDTRWLTDRLQDAVAHLRLSAIDLSVIVIDDAAMATLHEQYSGIAGTTDVLTFDLRDEPDDGPGGDPGDEPDSDSDRGPLGARSSAAAAPESRGPVVSGEIYICADEAARQARTHDHDSQRELLLYALHGLLHLLGYDDHDPASHRRMHAMEDTVLTAIGVGATFAPRAGSRPTQAAEDEQA